MWSLSVEEQFYLLYPPFLMLLHRLRTKRLAGILAILLVASLLACLYGRVTHPRPTFYLLPTRAWELLTGCLLAVTDRQDGADGRMRRRARIPEMLAIPAILIAFVVPWTEGGREFLAVAGAALVIRHPGGGVNALFLRNRLAIAVGRLSYSLYLWHWPVIVLARELGRRPAWPVQLLAACILALASYLLVEGPARRRKVAVRWILAAYAGTLGFAASLLPVRHTYDTSAFAVSEFLGLQYAVNPPEPKPIRPTSRVSLHGVLVPPRVAGPDAYRTGGVVIPGREETPSIVVLGDSHGLMWSDVIRGIAGEAEATLSLWSLHGESPALRFPLAAHSRSGRRLTPEQKLEYDSARVRMIELWKPRLVVVCRRWSFERSGVLEELVDFLCAHAERVLLVEQPPEIARLKDRNLLQFAAYLGIEPRDGVRHYLPMLDPVQDEKARRLVRDLADRHPKCRVIQVHDVYARGDEVLALDGREAVYTDDDHLTTYGARLATERFREAILEVLTGPDVR